MVALHEKIIKNNTIRSERYNMSKKHYITVARVLYENKSPFQLCSDLAVQFKNDNRLFDINRFLSACGH
jgi:hypothetical protein